MASMYPAAQLLRLRSASAMGSALQAATRSISTNRRERNSSTASAQRERPQSETDKFLHYSPEDGYYKTSPYDPVTVPNVPIHEYVWRDFKKWESRTAAVSRVWRVEVKLKCQVWIVELQFEVLGLKCDLKSFFFFLFFLILNVFYFES